MNKILIILLALIVIGGVYYNFTVPEEKSESVTSVTSSTIFYQGFGFEFQPPEGWVLWEGLSATYAAGDIEEFQPKDDESDVEQTQRFVKIQDYVNNWSPETSNRLTFTTSNVNASTRNLDEVARGVELRNKEPLSFNVVEVFLSGSTLDYVQPENTDEREVIYRYLEGFDGKIQQIRVTHPEYDSITVRFPLNLKSEKEISVMLTWDVDKENDNVDKTIDDFIRGYKL